MLNRIFILALTLVYGIAFAQQEADPEANATPEGEPRYIIDDLYTFMHAGPGRNYRILGSVVAGTEVRLLQTDSDSDFAEVIDDRQRTGWVDGRFVSAQPSVRVQIPRLQDQLREAEQALAQQVSQNDQLNQQLVDLERQNKSLQQRLDAAVAEAESLQQTLGTQDSEVQQEWLLKGGALALGSLILGIVLTYLPKKRRRNDGWM